MAVSILQSSKAEIVRTFLRLTESKWYGTTTKKK